MSDEIGERAAVAVELAVQAAGPIGDDARGWRRRVLTALGDTSAMLREGSDAMTLAAKIIDSQVFSCTYLGFEPEHGKDADGRPLEHPTRLVVHTQSDHAKDAKDNPEGLEHVRTEPLWTQAGRVMRWRLENELSKGDRILIYKTTEPLGRDKKVRVIVHFEVLSKNAGRSKASGPPPSPPRAEPIVQPPPTGESVPSPSGATSTDDATLGQISHRFEKLSVIDKVSFARSMRAKGIPDFLAPPAERMSEVLLALNEAEQQT